MKYPTYNCGFKTVYFYNSLTCNSENDILTLTLCYWTLFRCLASTFSQEHILLYGKVNIPASALLSGYYKELAMLCMSKETKEDMK